MDPVILKISSLDMHDFTNQFLSVHFVRFINVPTNLCVKINTKITPIKLHVMVRA